MQKQIYKEKAELTILFLLQKNRKSPYNKFFVSLVLITTMAI